MSPGRKLLRLAALAALVLPLAAAAPAPAPAHPLGNWTAVVVAGDWRAGPGRTTKAFDNGRRDVARALIAAGFSPQNVLQYSLRPGWPGDPPGLVSTDPRIPVQALIRKAGQARGGCLFYVTSHGSPEGAVFGPNLLLTPSKLHRLLDDACPDRPTVVVVSACFSGAFLPEMAAPGRMVMTAARRDRASFGCGADDVHTYFDECMIGAIPQVAGFLDLPPKVKACVAAKEKATGMSPPSEPQTSIGPAFGLDAGDIAFSRH